MEPQRKITGTNGVVRMTGEDRRLQILKVAMRLFSQHGFRGTTTKEIALAAGVSEAMVFRHFATKEQLYSAILDHKACLHETMDPLHVVSDAVARKDDRAVFEGIALDALNRHDCDPEFHRLLLHSALEEHELATMFWEKFVKRVYRILSKYVRERQREGAMIEVEPLVVVRAFVGMIIHHSLNNNLWDRQRQLLKVSNEVAARAFTNILLNGVTASKSKFKTGPAERISRRPASRKSRRKKASK